MNVLKFQQYIKEEYSKNDPIPELNTKDRLCIILMGTPAVGKTTFIKNNIKTKQDIKVFSTDDVSLKITKDPNIYHPNSSSLNIKMIFNFIKTGQSFIYDTTGTHRETITKIVDESSSKDYKIVFIHLVSTLNNSLERNKLRDRNVDEDYLKMSYSTQFKNISYYANLTNNSYYIVSTLDNKYVFYKYQNGKIVKRNNDKYI